MGTKLKRTDFYGFGEKIKKLKEKKKNTSENVFYKFQK